MNWIDDCEFLWKIIKICEILEHLGGFWQFRACFGAYTMLRAIFFFPSNTSLNLHYCILKGLEEKISLFFMNFAYSTKLVILRPFLAILGL